MTGWPGGIRDAEAHVCLTCAAMPGQPCVARSGKPYRSGEYVHEARLRAVRLPIPHEPSHDDRVTGGIP